MRKFIGLMMILALLWLAKLSYDSYQLSQRFDLLQQNMTQIEQNNANLNDHLVALQRQLANPSNAASTAQGEQAISAPIHTTLNPVVLIKQQLELVQFALQQHQYIYAVDKLNQLNQALSSYTLAPALERSLHESINKDKQAIQQFVISKSQQQQNFDDLIQMIDQDLQIAQENSHIELKRSQQHFWQGWFQLQRVEHVPAELVNRRIILKEVQLRLLLARQALNDGHLTEYQHVLNMATQQLAQFPDQSSQDLKVRLEKLKQLPAVPVPKLITLELLG